MVRRLGRKIRRNSSLSSEIKSKNFFGGFQGGGYKPLSDEDVQKIHRAALNILWEVGMKNPLPILEKVALDKGCKLSSAGRLCFPKSLVEDVIDRACKETVLYGRDPIHDIELSGRKVSSYGAGEAVTVLDPGSNDYRPSTIRDVYDIARVVDCLENINSFSRFVVPTEITDLMSADINTAYASLMGTRKHTALSFSSGENVQAVIAMLDIIAGGEGEFAKRPFCHGGGCTVVSPLQYGADNCEVAIESIEMNAPIWVVIAPQSGATAPATLAGSLAQCFAEALASLLLVDLIKPSHPVIFGPWPFVTDLRTGSFSGGGGEEALLGAASAQITNYYGLISSVGAGMTDSKLPDAQSGFEKGISVAMAALAGCNGISESSGMLASLMGCSYESLVIDNEMLGVIMRTVKGIEVSDETLSLEVIKEAVFGDGHFLRSGQTLEKMKSEYFYPEILDRKSQLEWREDGSLDIRKRAEIKVKQILENHSPLYIDKKADSLIRQNFPIQIDFS
tara:strand:- start:259 stop:1779 length:1521 start_codon:yes stop_codon:yes gene_type:complete